MTTRDPTRFAYRRIIILLVSLVVVPSFLLLAIGVLLLFLREARANILMGILVLALSGAAATGVILVWVFVKREASLSQLQSDFVSKVSHELRTPLTSIRLFSETLALGRGDEESRRKCMDGLMRETTRLQELIDRLLDWGRMESGGRQYQMRETDVYAIIDEAVAAFDSMREQSQPELIVSLAKDLPPIIADRAALSDAVLNLLTNALKYGGSPCRIELTVKPDRRFLRLSVSDNGLGIEAREQKRIFEKFYRIDDRLSSRSDGAGLGLAIVNHVVKAHRGKVEVESEPNQGSRFTIVLPLTPLSST